MITRITDPTGYAAEATVAAPAVRVFQALTTLDGLQGWWAPVVTGSPEAGGEITFHFGEERVVMRVEEAASARVCWTCVLHNKLDEWAGTTLTFDLSSDDAETTVLTVRHIGLVPALECFEHCELGWDYFVPSLVGYAEGRGGTPWRSGN